MLLFSGELVRFLGADEELRGPAEAYLRGLMFFGPMILAAWRSRISSA